MIDLLAGFRLFIDCYKELKRMNDNKIIILNLSDVSLLQEALRNYCESKCIVTENFQNQVYLTLRKLYSIEVFSKK